MAPSAPPVFGHSEMTVVVLASLRRIGLLAAHLDTRDQRSLDNLNKLDFENVRLGLLHALQLMRLMRRHRDAGVYLQVSQGMWGFLRDALWIWIARAAGRPVYVHLLGGRFNEFHDEEPAPMRRLIRRTMREAEEVWVLTESLRCCFDGICDPERVDVLETVVADPLRDPGNADAPPVPVSSNGVSILFLSNFREGKGHFELLAALERLGERATGWRVRLVGDGNEAIRRELSEMISARVPSETEVELVGPRYGADKLAELVAADIFALPPTSFRMEGQPLVLIEALAAGLPVVATSHRAIPDTVSDGREALLVEPGDVAELAEALDRLAGDPELRERLGTAARARYEENYVPERFDRDLFRLLEVTSPAR